MSRPLRINHPDAWYHVIDTGIARRCLFPDDPLRKIFLGLCEDITTVYGVEIHAYCLLSTQFHLLIRAPRANLSDAMRHLLSRYTTHYNQLKNLEGPLFRSRYKCIVVEGDGHILQVSRYIHRLPRLEKLSKILALYQWSSYPAYIGQHKPTKWLHKKTIEHFLAHHNGPALYRIFVETGDDLDTDHFYSKKRLAPVLGSDEFVSQFKPDTHDPDVADTRLLARTPDIETILECVASHYHVDVPALTASVRGRNSQNIPRSIAIRLCRTVGGHSLKAIAQAFNVSHYSSVSVTISRLEKLVPTNPELEQTLKQLSQQLRLKSAA